MGVASSGLSTSIVGRVVPKKRNSRAARASPSWTARGTRVMNAPAPWTPDDDVDGRGRDDGSSMMKRMGTRHG